MELQYSLSQVFPGNDSIVKVGEDMLPQGLDRSQFHFRTISVMQQRVSEILDMMGQLSAIAQDLKSPITSGEKVRNPPHPEHAVYILLDRSQGTILGFLKVGRKNLFLLDRNGDQVEVCPMCILDFYVHESRQRTGCGKTLFDHMLRDLSFDPRFMAIDRPSPKLLAFLKKHHDLTNIIPQVNNYVIFDGFFAKNSGSDSANGQKRPRIYMGRLQYV